MNLTVLDGRYAVVRLEPDAGIPEWVSSAGFFSVTRTHHELSLVAEESRVPAGLHAEAGWRVLEVEGPLDFSAVDALRSAGHSVREG